MKGLACNALLLLGLSAPSYAAIYASFDYGVASGDPEPTSIVLWTRVTPRNLQRETSFAPVQSLPVFNVSYYVYSDANLTQVVQTGSKNATVDEDWTVKLIAGELTPNSTYYYNFVLVNNSATSPSGKFKLPPPAGADLSSLKFFFFSCSNWPTGYFNAYDYASKYDLDFWMHLGDWYYEYSVSAGTGDIRWEPPPRGMSPSGDIQVLDDYRKRHALYRTDPGLQALLAAAPLIAIWDDHEFTNNIYRDGAQNQFPGEVEFFQRKHNALRAYTEWMPIRWNFTATPSLNQYSDYAINRTFQFGNLATLFMLEDRASARTNAGEDTNEFNPETIPSSEKYAERFVGDLTVDSWSNGSNGTVEKAMLDLQQNLNKRRTNESDEMLGTSQIAWIGEKTNTSAAANTPWQLYATGIIMQDWFNPDPLGALAQNLSGNGAVQAYWEEAFKNATTPGSTYTFLSTSISNADRYGKVINVTAAGAASIRAAAALGKFKINSNADSWHGYLWDRHRFLDAIKPALNPTVYAGDSHNFWAGFVVQQDPLLYVTNGSVVPVDPVVATEFDGGSVTSNGYESDGSLPLDFVNAAWRAANPAMFHVELRYKGGVYVQLTPQNQHVEYIYVDTIGSQNYRGFCGVAFDVPARSSTSEKITAQVGNCTQGPTSAPYTSGLTGGSQLRTTFRINQQPSTIKAGTKMPTEPWLAASA